MSHKIQPALLPAPESGLPSATDKAGRFPFSAVSSAVLVVATGLGLVACGGGGGSSAPTSVSVAGQAIKGPVSGGQVCAYTLSSPRQQIACATTDANANYQLQLPAGTGEVLLEVTGGSYIDEATGQKVALTTPLRTLGKAGSADNALITPFTELAVQRATTGNPGGKLTLVGFQTQIGQLEAGLGISGLATGNPFGGKSSADITHQKALEAFAKQQNATGKTVSETLKVLSDGLGQCGVSSFGATLAIYSGAAILPASICSAAGSLNYSVEVGVDFQAYTPVVDTPTMFDVYRPYSAWRTTLPASGKINLSDCQVLVNSTEKVSIGCGNKSVVGIIQIFAGGTASKYSFESQPNSFSPPSFAGDKVVVSGAQLNLNQNSPVIIHAGDGAIKTKNIITNAAVTLNSSATTKLACEIASSGAGAIVIGNSVGGNLPVGALPMGGSKSTPDSIQLLGTSAVSGSGSGLTIGSGGCLTPIATSNTFSNLTIQPYVGLSSSPRVIVNWQTFNVGGTAAVTFNQPTSTSGQISSGGNSGNGTVTISGGGLITSGTTGSGSSGITIVSKSN